MDLMTLAAARTHDVRARRAASLAVLPDAFSALPDAPVVPEREPRAPRTRLALATALHRLADGVAPRRPNGLEPRRPTGLPAQRTGTAGYAAGC